MELQFVSTEDQLADLFTKPLTKDRLISLRERLGMFPVEWSFKSMRERETEDISYENDNLMWEWEKLISTVKLKWKVKIKKF